MACCQKSVICHLVFIFMACSFSVYGTCTCSCKISVIVLIDATNVHCTGRFLLIQFVCSLVLAKPKTWLGEQMNKIVWKSLKLSNNSYIRPNFMRVTLETVKKIRRPVLDVRKLC